MGTARRWIPFDLTRAQEFPATNVPCMYEQQSRMKCFRITFQDPLQAISNDTFVTLTNPDRWKKLSGLCEIRTHDRSYRPTKGTTRVWIPFDVICAQESLQQTCLAFRNKQLRLKCFRIPFQDHLQAISNDIFVTLTNPDRWKKNSVTHVRFEPTI